MITNKKTIILYVLMGFFISTWVHADEIMLNPDHPTTYTVVKGDTLWDISGRFLQYPWQWPDIWHSNPQIENPHLIYPGDVISLEIVEGQPRLYLDKRTVKLSPKARITPLDTAIPTIPIDAIKQFLDQPLIIEANDMPNQPYVVGFPNKRLIGGGQEKFYVRSIETQPENLNYYIYRQGKTYRDPDTNEILGYEAIYIGNSKLKKLGDPATFMAVSSVQQIAKGDRVMPASQEEFQQAFYPKKPSEDISGYILSVQNGVALVGQYQIVAINKGSADGMSVGTVLAISQQGDTIYDVIKGHSSQVTLPNERSGYIMIFRTFDRISYALVMNATSIIRTGDIVHTP